MTPAAAQKPPALTERAERHHVDAPGLVRTTADRGTFAVIANLSTSGCLVRTAARAKVGEHVSVSLRGIGMRNAVVVRMTHDGFGCCFLDGLSPAEVRRMVAATSTDEPAPGSVARELRRALVADAAPAEGILKRMLRFGRRGGEHA